jgi:U3 small nucleolar RNA-associated protein 19
MHFFKLTVPFDIYKAILKDIEDIIGGFNNPARLLDFLKVSYDKGGVVSILSLNGVFMLIHKHNL